MSRRRTRRAGSLVENQAAAIRAGWRAGNAPLSLSGAELAAVVAAFVETSQTYSVVAPDFYSLRQDAAAGTLDATHLRATYLPAMGLSLAIGGAIGYTVHSWLPLAVAGATSLGMVALYESALPADQRIANPLAALLAGLPAGLGGPLSLPALPNAPNATSATAEPGASTAVTEGQWTPVRGGF